MKLIDLTVARWGNGLAVRINAQVARDRLQASMPMTEPVVEDMRRNARY